MWYLASCETRSFPLNFANKLVSPNSITYNFNLDPIVNVCTCLRFVNLSSSLQIKHLIASIQLLLYNAIIIMNVILYYIILYYIILYIYLTYWDILVKSFILGHYWDTFIRTTKKIRLSNLSCVIIASLLHISLYFILFFCCNVFIYSFGEIHVHYWED